MIDQDDQHDWLLYFNTDVQWIVNSASRRVATMRGAGISQEDVEQDAWLLVTDLSTELPGFAYQEKWGLLRTALYRDLLNATSREARNEWRYQSFDVRHDESSEGEGETAAPVAIAQRTEVSQYDRELVQSLLPAVWDETFCWGMQVENAPDADMPRSAPNKATGNTLAAHLADIRSAWRTAPLTLRERQCLFLVYHLDWTLQMAGANLGISHQTVSENALRGVGKIVATLNGDDALMETMQEEDAA